MRTSCRGTFGRTAGTGGQASTMHPVRRRYRPLTTRSTHPSAGRDTYEADTAATARTDAAAPTGS